MSRSSAGWSRRYTGTATNPLDRVEADTRFPVSAVSAGSIPNFPEGAVLRAARRGPRPMEALFAIWCAGLKAPEDHPRFASTQPVRRRTPRSADTQHLHAAMGPPPRTEHRCVSARTSLTPASFPTRGSLTSPDPAELLPAESCLSHDPGRLLAQVGDRLQDVPATLTFELMDPAHPIVDGVLDQRVRATDGALGLGRDHARSIDAYGSSAHRPLG